MIKLHPCQHERYTPAIALAEAIVVIDLWVTPKLFP